MCDVHLLKLNWEMLSFPSTENERTVQRASEWCRHRTSVMETDVEKREAISEILYVAFSITGVLKDVVSTLR